MVAKQEAQPAVWLDPKQLKPWGKNPRKNDDAVASVVDSIRRFGFGAPIVARRENYEIIAGHTRWKAAKLLGLKSVPVRLLDMSERDAHLLALADNKLGEIAGWDGDALANVLARAREDGADITGLGWGDADLKKALGENYMAQLTELDLSDVLKAEFFIQVRGPLTMQPDALDKLRDALRGLDGISVEIVVT